MATVMEVMARLTGNADSMVAAFRRAENESGTRAEKVKRDWSGVQAGFEKMAIPAAAIVGGAGVIGKKIGELASEAEQNFGAINAVFKENANVVEANSKKAAQSLGLSESKYQQFATLVGSQLKNLGMPFGQVADASDELIKKGADLASMFGGTTADAVAALSSMLKGEMDSVEKYGISIKQSGVEAKMAEMGLEGLSGEAEKNAKLTATLAIMNEQSADAMGNFAREIDTTAGAQARANAQWEEAQTKLGAKLLPHMTEMAKRLALVAEWLVPHVDLVFKWAGVLVGVSTGILAIVGAMKAWATWTGIITGLSAIMNKTLNANWVAIIVLAIAGLIVWMMDLYKKSEEFRNVIDTVWGAITKGAETVWGWLKTIGEGIADVWDLLITGEFKGNGTLFGIEEDHWFVDWVLDVRDNLVELAAIWAENWEKIKKVGAEFKDWFVTDVWPALQVTLGYLGDEFLNLYETHIGPAFSEATRVADEWWDKGMTLFTEASSYMRDEFGPAMANWWHTTGAPAFTESSSKIAEWWEAAGDTLDDAHYYFINEFAPAVVQWWDDHGKVAFENAAAGIDTWWVLAKDIFDDVTTYMDETFGPTFTYFADEVMDPAMTKAGESTENFWDVAKIPFEEANDFMRNTLGPTAQWLAESWGPVMDTLGKTAGLMWAVVEPHFKNLTDFVNDKLMFALTGLSVLVKTTMPIDFGTGAVAIGMALDKLKDLAMKPIAWVVENVFNALIFGYNEFANAVGGTTIKFLPVPGASTGGGGNSPGGNAKGGPTMFKADGGWVEGHSAHSRADNINARLTADEFVLRQGAARALRRSAPGALEEMNRTGRMPYHAAAQGRTAIPGTIWGQEQDSILKNRNLSYTDFAGPFYGGADAARLLDGIANVKVGMGSKDKKGYIQTFANDAAATKAVGTGGGVLGYAVGTGVWMNEERARSNSYALRRGTMQHEMLHNLGFPHTNVANSIMTPAQNPAITQLTNYDKERMRLVYGAPEKAAAKPQARQMGGGRFEWPVDRKWGLNQYPSAGHPAYDIGTPIGTRVNATASGAVTLAGSGYRAPGVWGGNEVHLDHGGGVGSLYAHLSQIMVKVGQLVTKGEAIAMSGNTGISSGPHLHYGALEGGMKMVSPDKYLNGDIPAGEYGGGEAVDPFAWLPDIPNPFDNMITDKLNEFGKMFNSPIAKLAGNAMTSLAKMGQEWAGSKIENVFETLKTAGELAGRSMFPGLFDNGGWMMPGQYGVNKTTKPEAVFTGSQFADLHSLAMNGGGGGQTIEIHLHFEGPVYTEEEATRLGKLAAAEITNAVMVERRGGVYVGSGA